MSAPTVLAATLVEPGHYEIREYPLSDPAPGWHPTKRFPHRSLLLVGFLVIGACFFDLVQIITALILARIFSMFVAQIIGLLVYRKYQPHAPRPFRMWLYPLPALFALVGWLGVFVTPALQPGGWEFMAYAFGTIGMGFTAYLILAWRKRDWPFAQQPNPSDLID